MRSFTFAMLSNIPYRRTLIPYELYILIEYFHLCDLFLKNGLEVTFHKA